MFEKLFSTLSGFNSFYSVLGWIQNLITHFSKDIQDDAGKDAAIDAVIEVLQSHKSTGTKS